MDEREKVQVTFEISVPKKYEAEFSLLLRDIEKMNELLKHSVGVAVADHLGAEYTAVCVELIGFNKV